MGLCVGQLELVLECGCFYLQLVYFSEVGGDLPIQGCGYITFLIASIL